MPKNWTPLLLENSRPPWVKTPGHCMNGWRAWKIVAGSGETQRPRRSRWREQSWERLWECFSKLSWKVDAMTQTAGLEFERRAADAIRHLDYEVKIEPREIAKRGTWQERLSSWMTQPTHIPTMPSMVVSNGRKNRPGGTESLPNTSRTL